MKKTNFPKSVPISGRVRVCLELVKQQQINNKVVVDIGSSFGWLEKELVEYKPKKLIGIEPNISAVKFAQKHVKKAYFIVGSALNLPLKKAFADIVILFDVIEHLPKGTESQVLDEISRVLKKDGILLLSTPNSHIFSNLFDVAWYFGHRHYSKKKISQMLNNKGFKIKSIESKGSILSSLYLTWFYATKKIFNLNQARNIFFEKVDDFGYKGQGITDIFLVAKKNH